MTKTILFPVRFTYTLRTGGIGLNDRSALWYGSEGPARRRAGARRRSSGAVEGIGDVDLAVRMLEAELGRLHVECIDEYAAELDRLGEAARAAALAARAAAVEVAVGDGR